MAEIIRNNIISCVYSTVAYMQFVINTHNSLSRIYILIYNFYFKLFHFKYKIAMFIYYFITKCRVVQSLLKRRWECIYEIFVSLERTFLYYTMRPPQVIFLIQVYNMQSKYIIMLPTCVMCIILYCIYSSGFFFCAESHGPIKRIYIQWNQEWSRTIIIVHSYKCLHKKCNTIHTVYTLFFNVFTFYYKCSKIYCFFFRTSVIS